MRAPNQPQPFSLSHPSHPPRPPAASFTPTPPQTDEDSRRLNGPGLLVVDTAAPCDDLVPEKFYLVEGEGGEALLVDGAKAAGRPPLGAVLFLCRPPFRDTAAAETSELLSL